MPPPPSRPPDLLISDRATCPQITAGIAARKGTNEIPRIPQTRLAMARPESDFGPVAAMVAAAGDGVMVARGCTGVRGCSWIPWGAAGAGCDAPACRPGNADN